MNSLDKWLAGGDLRSDGDSCRVAEFVLENPELLDELVSSLHSPNRVIRGRVADALEKFARAKPAKLVGHLPTLIRAMREDPVPMVRFHLAMTLGHLSMFEEHIQELTTELLDVLSDPSVFTVSWAIASLCIIARGYTEQNERITRAIAPLHDHPSIAIRTRVRKAMTVLTDPNAPFPAGWVKSEHLQHL